MRNGFTRWMIRNDLERVIEIEKSSFEYPWTRQDFVLALGNRNCCGNVYEIGDEVVGYMIYVLENKALQLINLAVEEKYRRNGIGGEMIAKLVGKLPYQKRERIIAEVRESNLEAQCFLRSMDFRAIAILPKWYEETDETAYGFEYICKVGSKQLTKNGV
jgi:[ribosomal protein S18]-alanine N-acetyltransferase